MKRIIVFGLIFVFTLALSIPVAYSQQQDLQSKTGQWQCPRIAQASQNDWGCPRWKADTQGARQCPGRGCGGRGGGMMGARNCPALNNLNQQQPSKQ
jgi:hypothetical protein